MGSSKFGSRPIMSRTSMRVQTFVWMVREVTDCGNLQSEGVRDSRDPSRPNKVNFHTFVNHEVYSKNSSGTLLFPPMRIPRHDELHHSL